VLGEAAIGVLRELLARPGRPASPFVFPSSRNPQKPWNGLKYAWGGIVGTALVPSAHHLRHAFAGVCHNDVGVSELTVSYLLGHAAAKRGSTTRKYIFKANDPLSVAADAVSSYIWTAMRGELPETNVIALSQASAA
jgi:integrase